MRQVVVYGVGGHARALAGLLIDIDSFDPIGFVHEFAKEGELILGSIPCLGMYFAQDHGAPYVLAIGDNIKRSKAFESENVLSDNIIHTTAVVMPASRLGESNQVFPNAYIGPEAVIGSNCIVNTGAIVEHESVIGSHCHLSIGSILSGRVKIGDRCFIGAGAIVKDGIEICNDVIVGAGGVVVKSITEPGVYVGNPVRRLR